MKDDLILYGALGVGAFILLNGMSNGSFAKAAGSAAGNAAVEAAKQAALAAWYTAEGIGNTPVIPTVQITPQSTLPTTTVFDLLNPFSYSIKTGVSGLQNLGLIK